MVSEILEKGMEAVEVQLASVVRSDIAVLEDASLHIVSSGGKRVRPRMVLLGYRYKRPQSDSAGKDYGS